MNDRTLVREQEREIRRMKVVAVELWERERHLHLGARGAGFLRYTGKPGAKTVRTVVDRCVAAGIEWRDIESAIRLVAADPLRSPWAVFDAALAGQAEREAQGRMMEKMRDDRPRVAGLRHIGATAE